MLLLIIIAKWNNFSWPEQENFFTIAPWICSLKLIIPYFITALSILLSAVTHIFDAYNEAKFTLKQIIANAAYFRLPNVILSIIVY